MKQQLLSIFILIIIRSATFAQNIPTWDLEKCISFAKQENLLIQQSELGIHQSQIQYEQAKNNQLPTANGTGQYGYNYGFSVNPINNQVVSKGLTSGSVGLNGVLNLFSGFQVQNTIRQTEMNVGASRADWQQAKRDISLSVAQAYMSVLLAKELYLNTQTQLSSTQEQLSRIDKLIKAGTSTETARFTLEAQAATEQAAITNAENQIAIAMLTLRQTMNVPADIIFEIAQPDMKTVEPKLGNYEVAHIYKVAEGTQPNIIAADMRIRSALIGIELAKAQSRPTLSLYAQTNTRFSSIAQRPSGEFTTASQTVFFNGQPVEFATMQPLYEKQPLFSQLTRNWGLATGLNLSVPIYNRGQVKTNIQLAEINIKNAQLNSAQQKQNLRQAIERAYLDVKISFSNYTAILKQMEAQEKALSTIQKQLSFGVGNQTDFILSKNNLLRSQNDLIRAKYDFLFKEKILAFYENGGEM